MLPANISFIDIETTGTSSFYDRIIEIGILRVENNNLVRSFHTLVNPQKYLPREIELLTGINATDLENAPTFREIKEEILEIISDSYFVAHNVRFDYGFLKTEFKRENITFKQKHFCTVKLSRLLYPSFSHHNLDSIIERFRFECTNRHRAYDDAKVLFDFYKKVQNEFPEDVVLHAINKSMKKPSVPLRIDHSVLEDLPENPGVYIFYGDSDMPLYVGKSKNIKDRVLSHFSSDIRSSTEMNISQQITNIETIPTAGELGALLQESKLIKTLLPLYNKRSRIKQELFAIKSKVNKDGYKEAYIEPISTVSLDQTGIGDKKNDTFLGFFRSRRQAKEYLSQISKKHLLCEKLLSLQKTKSSCFSYSLGRCKGACLGEDKPLLYNLRFITAFASSVIKPWPYKGPVIIEEKSIDGNTEYFLIHKWCYLGNVVVDEYEVKKEEKIDKLVFDLDTYRILRQFINNPQNKAKIHLADKNQLHNFGDISRAIDFKIV